MSMHNQVQKLNKMYKFKEINVKKMIFVYQLTKLKRLKPYIIGNNMGNRRFHTMWQLHKIHATYLYQFGTDQAQS